MHRRFAGSTIAFAVALTVSVRAQRPPTQQPPAQRAEGVSQAGVTAVLVDVVVRDRKGEPVHDLTPADFEILEDGVPQKVGSFRPVFENAPAPPPAAPQPTMTAGNVVGSSAPLDAGPTVVALVFDRLDPEARRLSVLAAQNYFGKQEEAPGYVGIFGTDLGLTAYVPFTRSVRALRQGLDKMASRGSATFNSPEDQQKMADLDQQSQTLNQGLQQTTAAGGQGTSQAVGTSAGDAVLAQMGADMIRDFQVMERDQQGYGTTDGLFAVIDQLKRLPGRKSLVFFSEGLSIPPAVVRLFLGVIDAANRANVSIYTMDAAGLRAESEQAKIRDEVNQAGVNGLSNYASSSQHTSAPLTKALEKNEDVLRQDPANGLGALAHDTGGLAFDNTNNLKQGFDRIESDLRNYYLIGYTPTNDTYDGHFRTIDIKVSRPGVVVAARKGYFAVRDTGGTPINSWEAPLYGALEAQPVPNNFPIRAGALLFPERDRPGLVPVIVDLKTLPLTFQPTGDGKTYSSDFAVMVEFIDAHDKVARKVSQHYEIKGPLANLDRATQGEVIFYREPELQPGVYTMQTIVYDAPTGKASVRYSTVEVPGAKAGLRVSSLVLVKRGEKVSEKDKRPDSPLLVGDTILYPNLGDPISKGSKEVGFYFAMYPPKGAAPQARLELLDNGKLVAQIPLQVASADELGRIQEAGRLPLDTLSPGTYELRAVVTQSSDRVIRSTMLRIVE